MNLKCKSVITAEIAKYFVGRRSWECVIWCHSCSYRYTKHHTIQKKLSRNIKSQIYFYCWWVLSDCAMRETWVPRGMTSFRQANMEMEGKWCEKNSLCLWLSHSTLTVDARIIPCRCISIKTIHVEPLTRQSNPFLKCWIAVERFKMTFTSMHVNMMPRCIYIDITLSIIDMVFLYR